MKYYIIAGEASGDLHAANLLREIKVRDPQAEIRAWGGDLMQEQGATIVKHYRELAFMGCDAIAILCTNMRGAAVAAEIEKELGVPVYDSVAVTLWKCLQTVGVDPSVLGGWGRLFAAKIS